MNAKAKQVRKPSAGRPAEEEVVDKEAVPPLLPLDIVPRPVLPLWDEDDLPETELESPFEDPDGLPLVPELKGAVSKWVRPQQLADLARARMLGGGKEDDLDQEEKEVCLPAFADPPVHPCLARRALMRLAARRPPCRRVLFLLSMSASPLPRPSLAPSVPPFLRQSYVVPDEIDYHVASPCVIAGEHVHAMPRRLQCRHPTAELLASFFELIGNNPSLVPDGAFLWESIYPKA